MNWSYEGFPPERRVVAVWLWGRELPFCGYMKHAAGDKDSPIWVVYHGNSEISADVLAWCDCLPTDAPKYAKTSVYADAMSD